ncbi:MAG: DUF3791 domain-containing protein [Spirochaetaceae bacterium]|jgi:hypothetical protein|nr:DUF3791 domain-containing protein [Spirochaetaceae bacterium]
MPKIETRHRNKIDYIIASVNEFARSKALLVKEAFLYLHTFKGIQFLDEHYEIEHTLSFDDVIEDLSIICRNNGGTIA